MSAPEIIAIDGPAASGKSTLAEKLAAKLKYLYLDTGVMYRAVTYAVLEIKNSVDDEKFVSELAGKIQIDVRPATKKDGRMYDVLADNKDITWQIRSHEVEKHVSKVSTYAGVRSAMTAQQRRIALRGKIVMVGRDIGTVVLPDADLKIYLDASAEERARRRYEEKIRRGERAEYDEILRSIKKRDEIDTHRALAPLRPAEDAVIINSDGKSIEDVYNEAMSCILN